MRLLQRYITVLVFLVVLVFIIIASGIYFKYISQKMYEESSAHLTEVYNQVNYNFNSFIKQNWCNLEDWGVSLRMSGEDAADAFIDSRRSSWNFSEFYFVNEDGECLSTNGSRENFRLAGLRDSLFQSEGRVISGETLAGGRQVSAFAVSVEPGSYRGFDYSAIAVTYTDADIIRSLTVDAFSGESMCFIVNADGEVLLTTQEGGSVFGNYFSYLSAGSDLTAEDMAQLKSDWAEGSSGLLTCTLGGVENYVYYQSVGYQELVLLGVVPTSSASKSLSLIQEATVDFLAKVFLLPAGIALLWALHKLKQAKKKGATEIQYREMLFNTLSVSINDIMLMLDADTFKADYLSPNVERLLGIPHKSALENIQLLNETSYNSDRRVSREDFVDIPVHESREWEREHIHRGTGERRWYKETVYHENIQGMEKYLVVMSDRTADREMNQRLEQALGVAKRANEAKSSFLSNMSHDIRTPMNAIIGFSVLLAKNADDGDRVREYTRKITASSRHLLGLINDVLDMSKIESGKFSLNISEFSLPELLEDLSTILLPQAKAKKQTFEIHTEGCPTERLMGDRLHLNQIMINLLSNAIKYTGDGGRIDFTVRSMPQNSAQNAAKYANLRFIVKDNGFGMSEEFLKTIFEPFSREVTSATGGIQGTGLGMAITKNLVDLMGGTIDVESKPGEGSMFTVDMPFAVPAEEENEGDFWRRHGISRILAADDEEAIRADISSIMEDAGVETVCVSNGREAVDAVSDAVSKGEKFDVILLDWEMPVMNGAEAAGEIREKMADVPIIMLSSYDREDIEDKARNAGISAFLTKPFFVTSFKQTVAALEPVGSEEDTLAERVLDGMKFLVAEDNEINAEILSELLAMENASADIAENGSVVLEMFRQSVPGHYDMILMDVQMPVMNGYEAAAAIRACQHPRAKSIPIIAMTANAFAEDVRDALKSGMNAHLAKPVDMDEVKEVIARIKNGKREESE